MRKLLIRLCNPFPAPALCNFTMLFFQVAVSIELIVAHGLKKLVIGVVAAEQVPNPLHLPDRFSNVFAISASIVFPGMVILGLLTRLETLPTLAVTLTGCFLLRWHDAPLVKDTAYIYSVVFLLILFLGPGKYSIDFYIVRKL